MLVDFTKPTDVKPYPFSELIFDASHVLIGGATGSGKTTLIDDIIYSILAKYSPNEARLILIDPKRVSFRKYKNLPHTYGYGKTNEEILDLLDNVIALMEKRQDEMDEKGLELYDGSYIFVIIDELADLMTTCKKEIKPKLQRIAQLGRASKIKLICATQAPNRDVIDKNLVVNFTGRLALRCLSPIESRQIIPYCGDAYNLPRHGKALYLHENGKKYEINVPLTPKGKLKSLIKYWENQIINTEETSDAKTKQKSMYKDYDKIFLRNLCLASCPIIFMLIYYTINVFI